MSTPPLESYPGWQEIPEEPLHSFQSLSPDTFPAPPVTESAPQDHNPVRNALLGPALATENAGIDQHILAIVCSALDETNQQLPLHRRVKPSLDSVLFGNGGTLDSLALGNFIVLLEHKLESYSGVSLDLTQDDPFSLATGHFRSVHSLTEYITGLFQADAEAS